MATASRNKFSITALIFLLCGCLQSQVSSVPSITKEEFHRNYTHYHTEIEYKLINGKLVCAYLQSKEITFLDDKDLDKNFMYVQYQDYYCTDRKSEAIHFRKKKNGKFRQKKVKFSFRKNVKSKGIFYDDVIEEVFYYPSVKPGDKIKLTFQTNFSDPIIAPKVFFNHELPSDKITFKITVPDYVSNKLVFIGDSSGVTHRVEKTAGGTVHYYEAVKRENIVYDEDSPGVLYYTPHVIPIPEHYAHEGKKINLAGNLSNLFERYNGSLEEMVKSEDAAIYQLTDSLVAGIKDTSQMISVIYDWVQKNIKYIAFEEGRNGFVPRPADKVYTNRYGDCKDKANLLITMFEHVGVPAYYTWIGTREKPYNYEQVPSPHCDNHMIVTVKYHDNYYFVDGTSTFGKFGVPSNFIQGKQAFIKVGNSYLLKTVPVMDASLSVVSDSLVLRLDKDKLRGSDRRMISGYVYEANAHNLERANWEEKELKEDISIGNNKLAISNFSYKMHPATQNIHVNFDFELPNYMQVFNDEIYFNPHLIRNFDHAVIDLEKRKLDMEVEYKYTLKDHVVLELNNEKVISLPEGIHIKEPDFSCDITYEVKGKKIEITKKVEVNHLVLKQENFEKWNKMVNELTKAYSNVIVLKKNSNE